jgi:hypothetical protein
MCGRGPPAPAGTSNIDADRRQKLSPMIDRFKGCYERCAIGSAGVFPMCGPSRATPLSPGTREVRVLMGVFNPSAPYPTYSTRMSPLLGLYQPATFSTPTSPRLKHESGCCVRLGSPTKGGESERYFQKLLNIVNGRGPVVSWPSALGARPFTVGWKATTEPLCRCDHETRTSDPLGPSRHLVYFPAKGSGRFL